MRSTREGNAPSYLGIDLTDRYATACRAIDVCGLTPTEDGRFFPSFWQWLWDQDSLCGACEVYPGHVWRILAGRVLPRKSTTEGRLARKLILEALHVSGLPELPTHDQNDACVVAVLAAAADGRVPGVCVRTIGSPLMSDRGTLREGPMVIPEVCPGTSGVITRAFAGSDDVDAVQGREQALPSQGFQPDDLARDLLTCFIQQALRGNPLVCTYSWAYRNLFHASYRRFSQAYARKVIDVAQGTDCQELPGLGPVRLDTFIVSKATSLPGETHWVTAAYDREDWERIFGRSTILD